MTHRLARESLAVFLFSVALLAVELSYTKLLSVVLWYHFGFLMVSTAMLGFAAAGVMLAFLGERAHRFTLSGLIQLSVVVTVVCYLAFTQIDLSGIQLSASSSTVGRLLLMTVLLFVPFLCMGLTVTWIVAQRQEQVGAIYGSNLLGSALGAVFFVFLFDHFPGELAVIISVIVMLFASAVLIDSRRALVRSVALVAALLPLLTLGDVLPIDPPREKWLGSVRNRKAVTVFSGWSSLSKVDVFRNPDRNFVKGIGLWGLSRRYKAPEGRPLMRRLGVTIDSGALTTIIRYPQNLELFDYLPSFFVHQLGNSYQRSLHIGAGGGIDLLAAHHYGVEEVHGVEINPVIVEVVKTQFDDYAGGIYTGRIDGVHIHLGEGRSFLERSAKTDAYDLIQLSGVDTSASSQAGAYALSENNLYTVEAFESYLDHLRPGGILTLSRWHLPDQRRHKTFSLRLVNLVRAALRNRGLDPEGRVFFFRDSKRGMLAVIAVKIEPFTAEEIGSGLAFIRRNDFYPMVIPGRRRDNIYEQFLSVSDEKHEQLLDEYPYRVGAPVDDSPFFFEIQRLGNVFRVKNGIWGTNALTGQETLVLILAELAALGLVLIALPLAYLSRRRGVVLGGSWIGYFALIGFAYMAVEISLSQKLVLYLGHPTYALSVVLAGMLFFSGIGSFLSPRLRGREGWALATLVLIMVVVGLVMTPVLDASLHMRFGPRLGVSLAIIAPLGLLMGLPMPMGIRRADPASIPFYWGVNGFFSVVGSVATVVASVNLGFTWALAVATACYALAVWLFTRKA